MISNGHSLVSGKETEPNRLYKTKTKPKQKTVGEKRHRRTQRKRKRKKKQMPLVLIQLPPNIYIYNHSHDACHYSHQSTDKTNSQSFSPLPCFLSSCLSVCVFVAASSVLSVSSVCCHRLRRQTVACDHLTG